MDDLISRAALLTAYDAAHKGPPGGARKLIADASAVDAVPVVHGRWERADKGVSCSIEFICSVCGDRAPLGYMRQYAKTKYCPNCGAKMDGKGETKDGAIS